MKKIAVFLADGFEEIEALSPVDYLRRAGLDVITVAVPAGGKTPTLNDSNIVTSSHKIPVIADLIFAQYEKEYCETENIPDCLICPGGSVGADNLSKCKALLAHLEDGWKNNKMIASICASPAVVLGKTSIPEGKKWTCYPGMESESKKEYLSGYENKVFITDGNLVTSRGPGASEEFAMELVRLLAGQEVYDKIHKGSQQR